MRLIIDIDEDVRVAITRMGLIRISDEMQKKVDKAIQRGTPLPKGLQGVYDKGYEDGKHDGYCSSIIERGIEQSHYKDDYEVKE